MKSLKSIASICLAAILALPATAVIQLSTSQQKATDQTILPTKADPGSPVAGELFLSTTTANRLKYYSSATLFTLATTSDLISGYQPLDAGLTTLSGGSDFVQFTGPATSIKIFTLPDSSATIITSVDTGTVTNTMLAGSIANAKLANSSITIAGTSTALGGTITLDTIDNAIAANGLIARTAANTRAARTITGTAGQVSVANGDGVAGNPTLSLPSTITQAETLSANVPSTSQTTGTLILSGTGGIGVGGAIFAASPAAGANTQQLTPSSWVESRALLGGVTRAIGDSLFVDGTTTSRRGYWSKGAAGTYGSDPWTVLQLVQVPTANPSIDSAMWSFGASNTGGGSDSFRAYLGGGTANLVVRIASTTSAITPRTFSIANFRTTYSGAFGILAVVRSGTTISVYWNGVLIGTETATEWGSSLAAAGFTLVGTAGTSTDWAGGILGCPVEINAALSAAEVLAHSQTGRLPSWCDFVTGSMVTPVSPSVGNGSFETAGGGGADVFASWNESVLGTSTITRDTTQFNSGAASCRFDTDASASNVTASPVLSNSQFPVGVKVRVDLYAKHNGVATKVQVAFGSGATAQQANLTSSWAKYTFEGVTDIAGSIPIGRAAGETSRTFWIDDVTITVLGPVFKPVIQPIAVVADAGSNKIAGILTAGVTPITDKRTFVIQGLTSTSGNQQLLGASVFFDATKVVLDDWWINNGGTSKTVSLGNVSAGTQYQSGGTFAAGRTKATLSTQVPATANLWVNSNGTDSLQHTITGHLVD